MSDGKNTSSTRTFLYLACGIIVVVLVGVWTFKNFNFNRRYTVGQAIDSLNGVQVYYNGGVSNVTGRNLTEDNYNLGLKYQCVEFVKRYYYEHLHHKMPDASGNAKDFFDATLPDSTINPKRGLTQYRNPSTTMPAPDDLLIFSGSALNSYGHVAIIARVTENEIEIIQQNPGPYSPSREKLPLETINGKWHIRSERILGWLRKEAVEKSTSIIKSIKK